MAARLSNLRVFLLWLLVGCCIRAEAADCPAGGESAELTPRASAQGARSRIVLRAPRSSLPSLPEITGLEEAKAILREGIVLPASLPASAARLFWRSSERSAILLAGPAGLGKWTAIEAAAAAAGAQMLPLLATDVVGSGFCRVATHEAAASGRPVVVAIDALETAPIAVPTVGKCLREAAALGDEVASRVFIVATTSRDLAPSLLAPFGYLARLAAPGEAERKGFLLNLFKQISRVDAHWGSAVREETMVTLASLTANYTFAEIDLVVRRAFLRSTNQENGRDPVALHHFEKIISETPPRAAEAFSSASSVVIEQTPVGIGEPTKPGDEKDKEKKPKSKDVKDPMDGIFGWCNFWLPEALHLPPVVWAMIVFGILAHFMARSTQPYGHRKRRSGGAGARSSLFGDMGGAGGSSNPYPSFGDNMNEWSPYGSSFANVPPPPSMAGAAGSDPASSLLAGLGGSRGGMGGVTSGHGPSAPSSKPQSFGPGDADTSAPTKSSSSSSAPK